MIDGRQSGEPGVYLLNDIVDLEASGRPALQGMSQFRLARQDLAGDPLRTLTVRRSRIRPRRCPTVSAFVLIQGVARNSYGGTISCDVPIGEGGR